MNNYYETFTISLTGKALSRLEAPLLALAEEEWEDEGVRAQLMDLASEVRSRLQRIAAGDLQE